MNAGTGFQDFTATTRPDQGPPRLAALRDALSKAGLDGFIVPRADAYQGEYVAPRDDRLAWLTGFTGSAGFCIVLPQTAGLFVDGRYRLQARAQVDTAHFTLVNWPDTLPGPWLRDAAPKGAVIGFDPWLHTRGEIEKLEKSLEKSSITIRKSINFLDSIWPDQPAAPAGPIRAHPHDIAGESSADKRARLAADLRDAGQRAAVITLPDSLCWLLNIRGADLPRNPVVQGMAFLHDDGRVTLFLDPARINAGLLDHLGDGVTLRPPDTFEEALRSLSEPVRIDPASAPVAVGDALSEAGQAIVWARDPCILPKACKNASEIAGMERAHLRDAAAMAEFLAWLDARADALLADGAEISEIDVARALEGFRRGTGKLIDIAFDTIAGSGPNGAIVHYRVTDETNRRLQPGDLMLVDSGGQYPDGTTDITRTIAIGTVGAEERAAFTRVLQGMIAVSRLRWPVGRAGRDLDAIARYPLWLAGQDYDHGTGHGVGAALSVHEGPQRLSRVSEEPLEPGMILSNEPGYYREGAFGIRLENLVVVREAEALAKGDDRAMMCFETLTWVPIDRRLIDTGALAAGERRWVDDYHAAVWERVAPRLSDAARDWLKRATARL